MPLYQLSISRVWHLPVLLCVLSCVAPVSAQEKPLGDVARNARTQKSDSRRATKVITNDDFGPHLDPVTPAEDPIAAINKARAALIADGRHSCLRKATHSFGPDWSDSRLTEVAGPDRFHFVRTAAQGGGEYIIIGSDVYRKATGHAWEKLSPVEAGFIAQYRFDLPDVLQFAYQPGELKLIGQESSDGVQTFHYQFKGHAVDMDRTVDIWLRASDHLPLKTHMETVTTSALSAPISWQENFSCTYDQTFTINAPQ